MAKARQQTIQALIRCVGVLSSVGTVLACANDDTAACVSGAESVVDASEKDLVDFSLDEVIRGLSPVEAEAVWQRGEHVPEGIAGTMTGIRVELAVASNTRVTQVAQHHEDPSDGMNCGDHLRANVALKWKTDDGALDESVDAELTAFGVKDDVDVSVELSAEMLSGSLQLPDADSVGFTLHQEKGGVGGGVTATKLAKADEGLAPIGRIETLLEWESE